MSGRCHIVSSGSVSFSVLGWLTIINYKLIIDFKFHTVSSGRYNLFILKQVTTVRTWCEMNVIEFGFKREEKWTLIYRVLARSLGRVNGRFLILIFSPVSHVILCVGVIKDRISVKKVSIFVAKKSCKHVLSKTNKKIQFLLNIPLNLI